ncbi:MAG: TIGR03668 family PPOX class F420-dependent oxidoreductase [Candidatus Limnocylindria bacterium]
MTPANARALFLGARVACLATADTHGAPHLVPVTFAVHGDRIVTAIDGKPKRGPRLRRVENIGANPRVSLLVDHYDEDWRRLWWVRADGAARIVEAGPELDGAFDALRDRYEQYREVDLIGPAIMVEVDRWTGWSAGAVG